MYEYLLNETEKRLVDNYRQKLEREKLLMEKYNNCQHTWQWDGRSHNGDFYVCTACGKIKIE